ncbi:FimD/PapC C-terminal domain-containing protein [Aeromonas dhakensis]
MATIRLTDGKTPPFGATIQNARRQEVGMVTDGGDVYLSGLKPGESLSVLWGGSEQCHITLPTTMPSDLTTTLQLACSKVDKPAQNQAA